MQENTKYGILNGMYKIYRGKYPEDDSYINHFSFPHLILMQEPLSSFLNTSTSESVIKLRHLVKGGYLKEDRVKFYLTEKALKYIVDRREATVQTTPDTADHTHTNSHWQNNKFKYIVVGCIIAIVGTVSGGIILHEIYPPNIN
jgi:hypothetical protein